MGSSAAAVEVPGSLGSADPVAAPVLAVVRTSLDAPSLLAGGGGGAMVGYAPPSEVDG